MRGFRIQESGVRGHGTGARRSPVHPFTRSPLHCPPSVVGLLPSRCGMVLVIVLIAVVMLSLAAYTFTELMLSENKAARLVTREAQARALAESAAEMTRLYLAQTPQSLLEAGGTYSNAAKFQAVQVIDDGTPRGRGRFTVISPLVESGEVTGVRFGLENESARLNLNTLLFLEEQAGGLSLLDNTTGNASGSSQSQGSQQSDDQSGNQNGASSSANSSGNSTGSARDLLMALPGMTEDIADAILDWIDEDDEPREFGAEVEYYSALGYGPKNGPLDTIEELLLVRGITPDLLFGADANRNGVIDPSEINRAYLAEATASDPEVDRGWAPYLTLYSKEANVRPDGTPRIDLNSEDLQSLHEQLETALNTDWANFIIAYRQFGPYEQPDSQSGSSSDEDNDSNENGGGNGNSQSDLRHSKNPFQLAAFLQKSSGGGKSSGGKASGSKGGGGKASGGKSGKSSGGKSGGGKASGGKSGGGKAGGGRGGRAGGPGRGGPGRSSGGGSSNQPLEEVSASDITLDFTQAAKVQITQILDLVGVGVRMQIPPPEGTSGQPKQVLVKGPFPDEPGAATTYLPLLMDHVTVNPATTIPGRININQASRVILQGIPKMDQQTLEQIISNREPELTAERPNRGHETWLYSEGLVDLDTMRSMMPFITGAGSVYRAQIVGYFDEIGPARRVEVVIDASNATTGVPRIVFWRDISNLGRGFGLDTLGTGPAQ
jgi:hypothetical protein